MQTTLMEYFLENDIDEDIWLLYFDKEGEIVVKQFAKDDDIIPAYLLDWYVEEVVQLDIGKEIWLFGTEE